MVLINDTHLHLRYEFATNEVVNSVACVTLETVSTETGAKEFIAVGTTVNRGEDLAAKGAVCSFLSLLWCILHDLTRHTFSKSLK